MLTCTFIIVLLNTITAIQVHNASLLIVTGLQSLRLMKMLMGNWIVWN